MRTTAAAAVLLIIAAALITGCRPTASAQFYEPEQLIATAEAINDERARATALAVAATSEARRAIEAQATGTAAAATQEAGAIALLQQATREALAAQATSQALTAAATSQAYSVTATAAHDAAALMFQQQAAQAEIGRQAEINRQAAAAANRAELMNYIIPTVAAAIAAAAIMIGLAFYNRMRHLNRLEQPIQWQPEHGQIALPAGRFEVIAPPRRQLREADPEPLALPAPTVQLPRITRGHTLIIATTGSGKTIATRELVDNRTAENQRVHVIDPHYVPGQWGEADVISATEAELLPFIESMIDELQRRREARHNGRTTFEPWTVATEELPALMAIPGIKRPLLAAFRQWIFEGRKLRLELIAVSQTTQVRSLGIEGESAMLQQFMNVLFLGKLAVDRYPELVQGMERPALLIQNGGSPQKVTIPYDPRKDTESPDFVPYYPFPRPASGPRIVRPDNDHEAEIRRRLEDVHSRAQLAAGQTYGREVFRRDLDGDGDEDIIIRTRPADPRTDGVETDTGFVPPAMVQRIAAMAAEGQSQRAMEREVYGYTGGTAYEQVREVLDILRGLTDTHAAADGRPNGQANGHN